MDIFTRHSEVLNILNYTISGMFFFSLCLSKMKIDTAAAYLSHKMFSETHFGELFF